ncbi:hypothetical protein BGZ52_005795 [Haplosporangium bisporale]|nr:hypothetical protein BGZ52_005795 [Haplosporangium bisporale]
MRGNFDNPDVACDTHSCLGRVPIEVIDVICDYLFPPQLSPLSCVNEALYGIVIERRAWNNFSREAQPSQHEEQMQEPKQTEVSNRVYMKYPCAKSTVTCEECLRVSQADTFKIQMPVATLHIPTGPCCTNTNDKPLDEWLIRRCPLCRKEHYMTIRAKIKIPPEIEHAYKEKSYSVKVYGLIRTSLAEISDRLPISKEFPQTRYRHKDVFFQSKLLYGEDPLEAERNLVRIVNKVPAQQQQQEWQLNAGDPVPENPQVGQ